MNQTHQKARQKSIREITEEIEAHQKAILYLANLAGDLILRKVSTTVDKQAIGGMIVK
jgi:hypothetical protein